MISIYSGETAIDLNIRKAEAIARYNKLIQWGRKYPTRFVEKIFQIQLMDYQKWIIMNAWVAHTIVILMSRNAGKSFLMAIYIMLRALLFPSQDIYIMANAGRQAQDTFRKLENIVKKNIASLIGTSDVFANEIMKTNSNTDGFLHGASVHSFKLYNGSQVGTLVSTASTIVGKRSSCNVYDEAGKIASDYFALTEPFTAQDSNFRTGVGFNANAYPETLPTQKIYASSAEGVDTHLWEVYCICAKNMIMGIPGYFCADIGCELPLHPILNGEPIPPLLKQSEVDDAMKNNEAKALREYHNIFDTTGGSDAAVSRTVILRNEYLYVPYDRSLGMTHKYALFFDPALQKDNSFILIAEIFKDSTKGYMAKIINGINLIKVVGKEKKPLRTPEQLEWVWRLIDAYNGGAPNYDNIDLYIDAGPGGGGRHLGDLLVGNRMVNGLVMPGITDPFDEGCAAQKKKFPNAQPKLHLIEPTKMKTLIYTALSEMMEQDLIQMTVPLPGSGELILEDDSKIILNAEEIRGMLEIDLMKEEIMAIQKTKTDAGHVIYKLAPAKERKMHDDRAYCLALLGWHLSELRKQEMRGYNTPTIDYSAYLQSICQQKNAPLSSAEQMNKLFNNSATPFSHIRRR